MGVWVERGRTAEYVELEDGKRGYLTRLGAGKAWIASNSDGIFRPSPNGDWEKQLSDRGPAVKQPTPEKTEERVGERTESQKGKTEREREVARAVFEFDQQARRDIVEIDQALANLRKERMDWEARKVAVGQMLRENPNDQFNGVLVVMLRQELGDLEKKLREINDRINTKEKDFEKRKQALLQKYPEAKLPVWVSYKKQLSEVEQ